MWRYIIALFLVGISVEAFTQADCIMPLTERGTNNTILIGINEAKVVFPDDTMAIIIRGNNLTRFKVQESLDSVISVSQGHFLKLTEDRTGRVRAISKSFIDYIFEARDGKTYVVAKHVNYSFKASEIFNTLAPIATDCASGGGGGVYSIANIGSGAGVAKTTVANTHQFRSIVAGANIVIDNSNPNEISIASTGGVGDNDYGDVVVTGSGLDWAVDTSVIDSSNIVDGSVKNKDLVDVSDQRLIGNSSGAAGPRHEIRIGAGLEFQDSTLVVTGETVIMDTTYNAGNGMWVRASDTGITYTHSGGTGTLVIPAGIKLMSARMHGSNSDDDVSGHFTLVLDYDASVTFNQDEASLYEPSFDIINRSAVLAGGPTTALPYIYDEGSSPQRQLVNFANGDITLRALNISSFSNWTIKIGY
jgi:hypothetical protein